MVATPNTWGVVLLFAGIFGACILWATRRIPDTYEVEKEETGTPGKTS